MNLERKNDCFKMILLERIPPTFNQYWRHRVTGRFARIYISREGKDFKNYFQALLEHQSWIPKKGELKLDITIVFPDKRKRDVDNYLKCLLDCMTGYVYEDDSQIVELTVRKKYKKGVSKIGIIPVFS